MKAESVVIDEKKRKEIALESKKILERFSEALEKVSFKQKDEKKKVGGFRNEGEGVKGDSDFRKRMFDNSPSHNEDSIIAESKKW